MPRPFTRSALRAHGKTFWAGFLRATGVLSLAKKWIRRNGAIVLTFHRVLNDAELQQTASLMGMIVRSGTFDRFLKYASESCDLIDLNRDQDWSQNSKLKLAITFDDGWSDNASAAYPIARQYQTPMVIFIVPEKTGTELPFWPERTVAALENELSEHSERNAEYIEQAIEKLKVLPASERERRLGEMAAQSNLSSAAVDKTMSWQQINELHAGGVTFGSHTSTHEILTVIPIAQAGQEVTSSRAHIEQKLNTTCALFSYPNGDCSEPVRDLVEQAGYKLAFLNQCPGVWTRACDPFLIPRVNVCEYHLVDSKGKFSPLIFEYTVVWSAAKGLLAQLWNSRSGKPSRDGELQECKSTSNQAV